MSSGWASGSTGEAGAEGFLEEGLPVGLAQLLPRGCLLPEREGTECQIDIPGILRALCGFEGGGGGGLLLSSSLISRGRLRGAVCRVPTLMCTWSSVSTLPWLSPSQLDQRIGEPQRSALPSCLASPGWPCPARCVGGSRPGRGQALLRVGRGRREAPGTRAWVRVRVEGRWAVRTDVAQTSREGWERGRESEAPVFGEWGVLAPGVWAGEGGLCSHVV